MTREGAASRRPRTGERSEPIGTATPRADHLRELLNRPLTSYYLVLGCTALLLALGLLMVLSASSISSLSDGQSPFSWFSRQLVSVVVGIPLMWACSRLPTRFFRVAGYPLMALSIFGLVLVLFVGEEINGAVRWMEIGSFSVQPSEPAKLGLALWGADLLARKEQLKLLKDWKHLLIPLTPGLAVIALLVMAGRDLGTTIVIMAVFLSLLWVIGAPMRLFAGMFAMIGLAVTVLIVTAGYRMDRLEAFLDPEAHAESTGYQVYQAFLAIGSGGWFGRGLGASRAKFGHVPHAESDFIFAIIGEELGLLGTLLVVTLFGMLGYAGLRIAMRSSDTFVRLAAAAATAWLIGQAIVNIGTVVGLLPVTGIPLPLVSSGGSALLPAMAALGMLLAFARMEPGAAEALAARGPNPVHRAVARGLGWLGVNGRSQ